MGAKKIMRVLIIEDFELTRALLKVILRSDSFEIIGEADNGEAGLEMALRLKPDIVLLDNFMPRKNGIEILPEMRKKLHKAEILMVTSETEIFNGWQYLLKFSKS